MALALLIFGVAFAAFCVWLTVRIINRREQWAKWTLAAVVGVPMLYVASFGPACWVVSHTNGNGKVIRDIYWPLVAVIKSRSIVFLPKAIEQYSTAGAADGWQWYIGRTTGGDIDLIWRRSLMSQKSR